MNSEVSEALELLGYGAHIQLPTLQEVRKQFFKCARRNHPDKNSDADIKTREEREETFKKLLNSYNILAEAILESDHADTDDEDYDDDSDTEDQGYDEIEFNKEEFEEVSMHSTNIRSVTIKIPTIHADAWKDIFQEQFGIKSDRTSSSNGIQFKTAEGVSITLWKKMTEDKSTILIDGKKGYLNFAEEGMRKLKENDSIEKDTTNGKKRKKAELPSTRIECQECPKTVT